jgi:predicted nucleotidyltransferase
MLDLTQRQLDAVQSIMHRRLPGREVRAFGSRASGTAKPHSDLDLVIMGDDPVPALVLAELRDDLDDSDLPFRVDVLEWRDLPAAWRAEIVARSVAIGSAVCMENVDKP